MDTNRVKLLENYIKDDPEDAFSKYALALEVAEESPKRAAELFDDLLVHHPHYTATYYHAANFFFDMEDWEKAKTIFEKGIEALTKEGNEKALQEIKNSYQNFLFETEY